ncbi:MAG TPA: hypothetical protein VJ970_03285 [Flavobacteriaceae bacterium]|nr:hypothetical protein [Flavobacteriaceae bacterium]
MFIQYEAMPSDARVWVYQSTRKFTNEEENKLADEITAFLNSWKRHGKDLKASFKIFHNQLIVILVDEKYNPVSGCAIDASVNFMKQLEKEYNIDLTNNLNISFFQDTKLNVVPLKTFKEYIADKKVNANTTVFNNLVTTKAQLETDWEVAIANSWHNRFLV